MHSETNIASLSDAHRNYPAPGNKRAYIHQSCDNRIVTARPDLKFQIYNALSGRFKTGFGFVLLVDGKPEAFDFERVEQRFENGAFPILSQRISQRGFRFFLESFTTKDLQNRGVIMLRLSVWRIKENPANVEIGFLLTHAKHAEFSSHPNEDYIPFESWGVAWDKQATGQRNESCFHDGTFLKAVCRHSSGMTSKTLKNTDSAVWSFQVNARRDQAETVEVLIPYECFSQVLDAADTGLDFCADNAFRLNQQNDLDSFSFSGEKERQRMHWTAQLARATRIQTSEAYVLSVYQTLTLNNLQFMGGSLGIEQCRPGQGGYNDFSTVYAWESSHYLTQMAKQGYHVELRRVLDYFLTTQSGHKGPEGDFSDSEGSFRPHIHWVNETGAVLQIFAEYVFASGDFKRLKADAGALLKAARWIQRQRNTTRELLSDGNKALHYGLLPKGRPHDWPIRGHFIFSDTYTWAGLNRLAQVFEVAGLQDADWLRKEADEYRDCILAAVRGSIKPHPRDPSAKWVPSDIYEDPVEAIKTTIFCGPNSLIASGILDSKDELIPLIEQCLRVSKCMNEHFAFRMRLMEDETLRQLQLKAAGGHVDLYYVTFSEIAWQRTWLERGEREKAQTFYYSMLGYAVSHDLHLAQERFCPQLPWLLPWQPNASANGRILSMILENFCRIRDGVCYLLQGVSDTDFAARSPLGVDGIWISGSRFSFRLDPKSNGAGWNFSYQCDGPWTPECIRIALPCIGGGRRQQEFSPQGSARENYEIFA
jgi:hypothetical protein